MTDYRYALVADADHYIALDKSSGGYPYLVPSLWQAEIFKDREAAAKYTRVFAASQGGGKGNWPWIPAEVGMVEIAVSPFNPIELGKELDPNTPLGQFTNMLTAAGIEFELEIAAEGGAFTVFYMTPNGIGSQYIFTVDGVLSAVTHWRGND